MKKINYFQITRMVISGFKSFQEPTELVFGNPTVITGGNGRGKSSVAEAIAFAVTGLPFFGERGIDRLHNEVNPDVSSPKAVVKRECESGMGVIRHCSNLTDSRCRL